MSAFDILIAVDDSEVLAVENIADNADFSLEFDIKTFDFGVEYTPVIRFKNKMKPEHISVKFLFDGAFDSDDTCFFNNASTTNDWARIEKLRDDPILSRDIAMVQNSEQSFCIAMTSAEKFFTTFRTDKKSLSVVYETECKTVAADKELTLESFVVSYKVSGGEFFDRYCSYLAEKFDIKLSDKIDTGWSSWSCYYHDIDENNILMQSENLLNEYGELGADLIQIDDSWQNGWSFCCDWTGSKKTFPSGMAALSEKLAERNQRLGLWLAPTLVGDSSEFYAEHPDYAFTDAKRCFKVTTQPVGTEYSVYTLDLENKAVKEHIKASFENALKNYGCKYFKIDFTNHSLFNPEQNAYIRYKKGYSTEVYKNITKSIRKTVGKDTFLLACTAPITESVGVFDAIRTTPDVTWERYDGHPGYWHIIKHNAQNILLRSYYNGKVFACDPDALLVRGVMGDNDDDFTATEDEARLMATLAALSGGTILINEELEKLDENRKAMIKNVLPPIGIAAHPADFFEFPYCTKADIEFSDRRIATVFNWDDTSCDRVISNRENVFAFDCWTKEFLGEFKGDITLENLPPHSARSLLLVRNPSKTRAGMAMRKERPFFLCDDTDFYMGVNKDYDIRDNVPSGTNRYFYIPHDFMTFGLPKSLGTRVYKNNVGEIYKIEGKKEIK